MVGSVCLLWEWMGCVAVVGLESSPCGRRREEGVCVCVCVAVGQVDAEVNLNSFIS